MRVFSLLLLVALPAAALEPVETPRLGLEVSSGRLPPDPAAGSNTLPAVGASIRTSRPVCQGLLARNAQASTGRRTMDDGV